jgi:RNA polymerase sigma-70 factor (ECF subfamily)
MGERRSESLYDGRHEDQASRSVNAIPRHQDCRGDASGGDHQQFDALFVSTLPTLYSRVLAHVRTRDEADETIQEVYLRLRATAARQAFVSHPNPVGYLVVTAVNLLRDQWRWRQRTRAITDRLHGENPWCSDGGIAERESGVHLRSLLECLNRKEAAAIVLVDLVGYSLSEAAQVLGVKKATVHRNRARGLERLRSTYRDPRGIEDRRTCDSVHSDLSRCGCEAEASGADGS